MEVSIDLMMRVDSKINGTRHLKLSRWKVEAFITKQGFPDSPTRVVKGFLWVKRTAVFKKAALSIGLGE